jgi:hypothetical protein
MTNIIHGQNKSVKIAQKIADHVPASMTLIYNIPLPAAPTVFLAVHLQFIAVLRAYPVPNGFQSGANLSILPAVPCSRWAIGKSPYLTAHLFGSSLSASLACMA